jgi:anti-sigma regulatory factor (Ser/Thr protein kinase)
MDSGNENTRSLLLELPASTDSVGLARHALHGLSETLPSPVFEDLRLLVSELLTNSIRHTGLGKADLIQLQVTRSPGIVRVEVTDNGPGFSKEPARPLSERESGWGLFLVEQISDRWGLSVDHETTVWFELDIANDGQEGAPT